MFEFTEATEAKEEKAKGFNVLSMQDYEDAPSYKDQRLLEVGFATLF